MHVSGFEFHLGLVLAQNCLKTRPGATERGAGPREDLHLSNLSALVVSSKDSDSVAEADLEGH